MSILVDGYNYIGRSQELLLNDAGARDKVIYLMGQYCARVKKSLTLIFDGNYFVHLANRKRRYGRVTVVYTSPIYTADDTIKKMIKNQEARRRKSLLVVSSDQEILQYAQSHGTQALKSEEFERRIYQALAKKKGIDRVNIRITEAEVQEWLKIFGPDLAEETPNPSQSEKYRVSPGDNQRKQPHIPPDAAAAPGDRQKVSRKKQKKKTTGKRKNFLSCPADDTEAARSNIHLSAREVEEWMAFFGEAKEDEEEE